MRGALTLSALVLLAAVPATPTSAEPLDPSTCLDHEYYLLETAGVLGPGESHWYDAGIPQPIDAQPRILGSITILESAGADLYGWSWDCQEIYCAGDDFEGSEVDPLDIQDTCYETDCCGMILEVRSRLAPGDPPTAYWLRDCFFTQEFMWWFGVCGT